MDGRTPYPLVAMAKAANVNLLWLATGEGPISKEEENKKKKVSLEDWLDDFEKNFPYLEIILKRKEANTQVGMGEDSRKIA